MKKHVYVESSVISYLTSRPSRDIVRLGKQRLTIEWWERRASWELFLSQTVMDEIGVGDRDAVEKRLLAVREIQLLPVIPEARRLANELVTKTAVPVKAATDALHLAMAAVHNIHYLLTWNQRHLDNPDLRIKIEAVIRQEGWTPAIVLTPERLLEGKE